MKHTSVFYLPLFLLFFSCSNNDQRSQLVAHQEKQTSGTVKTVSKKETETGETVAYTTDRKIIKEGEVAFTTKDVNATESFIKQHIISFGGYISSENIRDDGSRKDHVLEVKVPSANFDAMLEAIVAGIGQPDRKDIHTQDVTEDYIDTDARIKAMQNVEARYFELLKQAKTIEEMLKVENELRSVRQQIETAQGHLNYLGNKTAFSSLKIIFYEPLPVIAKAEPPGFAQKFAKGLQNGWDIVLLFALGLANIWPFISIGLIALFIILRNTRKIRYAHK